MELDVHLKRDGAESWGFRLIGGKDFNMPLTVVKVSPESPADRAGLQNGDAVCSMNDRDTQDLSHDSAKQVVVDSLDTLKMTVKRGLYDPVLDDYEPIYEPVDQGDFDQPSQPTEVDPFAIQQFLDNSNPELPELRDIETPGYPIEPTELLSRSLTASPFVLPTKPYRPFSTEPLPQIPSLEDPIILNPNYKDQFGNLEDGETLPETRFKLPISEQYDPDGSRKKGNISDKTSKETLNSESSLKKTMTFEERAKKENIISEEMQHKTMIDEVKFMKKMKEEIDMQNIEMTAISLVDENIERAVSVADEIKKEIDVELSEHIVSAKANELMINKESVNISNKASQKITNEANELVELIDKTTEDIISYNGSKSEVNVAKEVEKIEINKSKDEDISVAEKKLSAKREIEESIVSGSVRRKSEIFDKHVESNHVEQQVARKNVAVKQDKIIVESYNSEEADKSEVINQSTNKGQQVKKESISASQKSSVRSDTKSSQYKAYTIGLQTIPNIKGTIHSSYHYNLLLKTFFIHLTDVMVALSRFILTESVFNKDLNAEKKEVIETETTSESVRLKSEENIIVDEKQKELKVAEVQEDKMKRKIMNIKSDQNKIQAEEVVEAEQDMGIETSVNKEGLKEIEYVKTDNVKDHHELEDVSETRTLTGAKMAQMTERKSEELTLKMGAVISEFETKAGIESSTEARERRSRSRSRIEEEVARESDPLEWLSKVDKQTQEITELNSESKSYSTVSESVEQKRVETTEKREKSCSKTKSGNQMYVAIVESHVFTNKDAIFEDHAAELSETSSVQSADEVNIALQANETIATEKVALESKQTKKEVAEATLEESRELTIINAQNKAVEVIQDIKSVAAEAEKVKNIKSTESTAQDIVIQEVIEPVIETQEVKKIENSHEEVCISEEEQVQQSDQIIDIREEKHTISGCEIAKTAVKQLSHETVHEKHHEEQSLIIIDNTSVEVTAQNIKEEVKALKIEKPVEVIAEVNIKRPTKLNLSKNVASSELKIIKEQVVEVENRIKCIEETESSMKNQTEVIDIENHSSAYQNHTMESYVSNEVVQEASFTAKTSEQSKKLTLQMDLAEQRRLQSQNSEISEPPSTIDTPTPSTVPPTPLTDEYVFKLQIPLPKNVGTPIPRDCTPTPEDEDPHIVKKKLIAHIDTTLDSPVIYDPPLSSPPVDKVQSPVYTKPGLRGGSDRREYMKRGFAKKEEILEIERKSSLLASAIDETIKCIEEYKEEVGIDTKTETKTEKFSKTEKTVSKTIEEHKTSKQEPNVESQPIIYNGYAKTETKVYNSIQNNDSKMDDEWNHVDEQVKSNNEKLSELSVKIEREKKEKDSKIETRPEKNELLETTSMPNSKELVDVEKPTEKLTNGIDISKCDISASFDIILCPDVKPIDGNEAPPVMFKVEEKKDPLEGYRPIQFNPEELRQTKKNLQSVHLFVQAQMERATSPSYLDASGQLLGTYQGIVDGLEEAVVDAEVANAAKAKSVNNFLKRYNNNFFDTSNLTACDPF
ncbi:hypothetical protein evm_008949 [Chilo suppressalis]|nr:hypothetical protein evm_008949 [Chilo suppressalis]